MVIHGYLCSVADKKKRRNSFRNLGGYSFSTKELPPRFTQPGSHGLTGALLEGEAEGAVTAVAAVTCQLLGDDSLSGGGGFLTEGDEVVDAQIIDIGIIGDALAGEVLAEIGAVGADGLRQLL